MTSEKGDPMAGKLVHFEIASADEGRAMDFYKQVFGWEFQDSGMPGVSYNLTEAGGQPGGAVYAMEDVEPSILVYFDTDDMEGSIAKVRDAGGQAEDKQPIPGVGWFSHCTDTEGNRFGLFLSDESVAPPG
jgi:predicted enzyme related to lactoylglutathione lyase